MPSAPHMGNTVFDIALNCLISELVSSVIPPLFTFITAIAAAAFPRYSLRHADGRLRLKAIIAPS